MTLDYNFSLTGPNQPKATKFIPGGYYVSICIFLCIRKIKGPFFGPSAPAGRANQGKKLWKVRKVSPSRRHAQDMLAGLPEGPDPFKTSVSVDSSR